jgi:hypothetical protein
MKKYKNVYQIVTQLTDNDALRTFFILYLMNEGDNRTTIEHQFWQDVDALPIAEKDKLTDEVRQSFFKLPHLIKGIQLEAQALKMEMLSKAA